MIETLAEPTVIAPPSDEQPAGTRPRPLRRSLSMLDGALVLAAIAGHAVSWALPGWCFAVWIGQASLIALAARHTPRMAFVLGLLVGTIANGISFHWAPSALQVCFEAPWWLSYLLFGILTLWESVAFGVFALLTSLFLRQGPKGLWLVPMAWVATEHWWPKVFPWMLGYTQLEFLPILQIAEITGSSGVSFIVTALCAIPVGWMMTRGELPRCQRQFHAYAIAASFAFVACIAFGVYQVRYWSASTAPGRPLKLGVLQVNIAWMGAETRLRQLSQDLHERVDLVCWPESSIGTYDSRLQSFSQPDETAVLSRNSYDFLQPTEGIACDVLCGGRTYHADAAADGPYRMTAFLVSPDQAIQGTYHKRTLIPFGEYMPGQKHWPALREWATLRELIEPGTSAEPIVSRRGDRLGVIICYEDLDRSTVRATAREGAEVFISIIHDGAFENPLTLEQHKRLALMRAVEHRKYFVRCASTGITCVVAPNGQILEQAAINDDRVIERTVQLNSMSSFYTRYGDWLPLLCTLGCGIGCVLARSRRTP